MSWETAYDPQSIVPALSHRVVVLAQKRRPKRRPKIATAQDVFDLLGDAVLLDREAFYVLPVDKNDRLIGIYVAHIGGTSTTIAEPKVILRMLLATQAEKVVVIHNHPSGFNSPSREDIELTSRLKQALDFFEIELVDHVILAREDEFFSFAASGLL